MIAGSGDDATRALADGGPEPYLGFHRADVDGIDPDRIASNVARYHDELGASRVRQISEDFETLADADVRGIDEVAGALRTGDLGEIRHTGTQVRAAVAEGPDTIRALEFDNPHAPGRMDIVTRDGRVIEIKAGDTGSISEDSAAYGRLEDQIGYYQQYTEVEGGEMEIVFSSSPSQDARNLLRSNDVDWRVQE